MPDLQGTADALQSERLLSQTRRSGPPVRYGA